MTGPGEEGGGRGPLARVRALAPELGRFLATATMGLAVDLAIATALILVLGLPDMAAAALGLFAGMLFNYVLHLTWTFRAAGRRASAGHFLRFALGVAATLVLRLACLAGFEAAGADAVLPAPLRLFLAAALSFAASFLISRHLVFARVPAGRDDGTA